MPMSTIDPHVSPLGRVEGDLDLRVTIDDGVVTAAWTDGGHVPRVRDDPARARTRRPA